MKHENEIYAVPYSTVSHGPRGHARKSNQGMNKGTSMDTLVRAQKPLRNSIR
jgi:hypothetical protein